MWQYLRSRGTTKRNAPLPTKPSIAILPFINMSSDAEYEYFADGLTEDLITDLSKASGLFRNRPQLIVRVLG